MNIRQATDKDYDFVYQVKVDALKEYIEKTWGWDEKMQQDFHKEHLKASETQIINVDNDSAGFLIIEEDETEFKLNEINLLQKYQGRGVGSIIISNLQKQADELNKSVWLQVLKVNPAINLYKRLGFKTIDETDTHFQLRYKA
jgi:ribosomal protein S18 acetylase RimI-like enzyme